MANFVPAVACHFFLALLAAFTQPGVHLQPRPVTSTSLAGRARSSCCQRLGVEVEALLVGGALLPPVAVAARPPPVSPASAPAPAAAAPVAARAAAATPLPAAGAQAAVPLPLKGRRDLLRRPLPENEKLSGRAVADLIFSFRSPRF